jgi:hypothetical protein
MAPAPPPALTISTQGHSNTKMPIPIRLVATEAGFLPPGPLTFFADMFEGTNSQLKTSYTLLLPGTIWPREFKCYRIPFRVLCSVLGLSRRSTGAGKPMK